MDKVLRVFCCHNSKDKPHVRTVADHLAQHGIVAWVDEAEILAGQSFIAKINEGLERCTAGLIFFSHSTLDSKWVKEEIDALNHLMVERGIPLIPVMIDKDAEVPKLLAAKSRVGVEQIDLLVDAIRGPTRQRDIQTPPAQARERTFTLRLEPTDTDGLRLKAWIDGAQVATETGLTLDFDFRWNYQKYMTRAIAQARRQSPDHAATEANALIADLGRQLGRIIFAGTVGQNLKSLLNEIYQKGDSLLLIYEAADPNLLALPYEAARLDNDKAPALTPGVRALRRHFKAQANPVQPQGGPLRILVAVGAPDADNTANVALDIEAELQTILTAIDAAKSLGKAEVRILEVGHPNEIAKALAEHTYHVLHISGHGGRQRIPSASQGSSDQSHAPAQPAGTAASTVLTATIEMEDEDGRPVEMTPDHLVTAIRSSRRAVPLIYLASCHTGTGDSETASYAQALLENGMPLVLAMQGSVSDYYSTRLTGEFYAALCQAEQAWASVALATARNRLEQERLKNMQAEKPVRHRIHPEYATPTLFCSGQESPIIDRSLKQEPLKLVQPLHLGGPIPMLEIGDLIGRRKEQRRIMAALVPDSHLGIPVSHKAGAVICGIGGVGKSVLAGRIMARLRDRQWRTVGVVGKCSLQALASAAAFQLFSTDGSHLAQLAMMLGNSGLPDEMRIQVLCHLLENFSVLLVLDNFEDNLTVGGHRFLDETLRQIVDLLIQHCKKGKLLLTCRYPVPGLESYLERIDLGPLSPAESHKLFLRLQALQSRPAQHLARILKSIGGHPRMIEYVDAILRHGEGRFTALAEKLRRHAREAGLSEEDWSDDLEEVVKQATMIGAADIILDQLLEIVAEVEGDLAALRQGSVFELPFDAERLAYSAGGAKAPAKAEVERMHKTLRRLLDLSLVSQVSPETYLVHRWTAEALKTRMGDEAFRECCRRAGECHIWSFQQGSRELRDIVEAIRRYLDARSYDQAMAWGQGLLQFMERSGQTVSVSMFAAEIREALPEDHEKYPYLCVTEGDATAKIGQTTRALELYQTALAKDEERAAAHPEESKYQRGISVGCNKIGGLLFSLGRIEQAMVYFRRALDLCEQLVQAEPDRADYRRDLSVSYERMGSLLQTLGQGDAARGFFQQALDLREQLVQAEPDRADYRRDLATSYGMMGDLLQTLGQGDAARGFFQQALDIREQLVQAEPDHADYRRDLAASYSQMGSLLQTLGQGDAARGFFQQALDIREQLVQAEPDRADYRRDLATSYGMMGSLLQTLGQGDAARGFFQKALDISEQLVQAEPDRADYRRNLAASYERMGDLYRDDNKQAEAIDWYQRALSIRQSLIDLQPDNAMAQCEIVIPLHRLAVLIPDSACELLDRAEQHLNHLQQTDRLPPSEHWRIALIAEARKLAREREIDSNQGS